MKIYWNRFGVQAVCEGWGYYLSQKDFLKAFMNLFCPLNLWKMFLWFMNCYYTIQ